MHKRTLSASSTGSEVPFRKAGSAMNNASFEMSRLRMDHEKDGEVGRENESFDMSEEDDSMSILSLEAKVSSWDERIKWWKVYAMHFLYMWNSRTYEYVSIFLVALAFPGSLTATSIRGITSTISAMLCASAVGNWIDRSPSRLSTMLVTINLSHFAIIASYVVWLYLPSEGVKSQDSGLPQGPFSSFTLGLLYGTTLFLDIIHDLNGIANRLSIERDWVPVLVGPITADMRYGLTQVNSVVRRIDLIVSLVSPSLIPLVMSSFGSRTGWLLFLACMTGVLWVMEIWLVRHVSKENPEIRAPKKGLVYTRRSGRYGRVETNEPWSQELYRTLYLDPVKRMKQYFSIPMWPASISTALLELTVLAYSATLITYLIEIGFTVTSITIARATGTALGLSSTVITPWAVGYLKKRNLETSRQEDEDDGGEGKAVRTVGMWGISEQFICMIPVVLVLWGMSTPPPKSSTEDTNVSTTSPHVILPLILFGFLSLSRIGHYMIGLMVQELGQVEILPSQRSTFAGTEQSFRSLCELCHWAATVVWSQPEQFRWLALGSLLVVGTSVMLFCSWSRMSPYGRTKDDYEGVAMDE